MSGRGVIQQKILGYSRIKVNGQRRQPSSERRTQERPDNSLEKKTIPLNRLRQTARLRLVVSAIVRPSERDAVLFTKCCVKLIL